MLGVQLLRFVLLMKLELQDATNTLDAFLWRDAVSFLSDLRVKHQEESIFQVVMMMVSLIRSYSSGCQQRM